MVCNTFEMGEIFGESKSAEMRWSSQEGRTWSWPRGKEAAKLILEAEVVGNPTSSFDGEIEKWGLSTGVGVADSSDDQGLKFSIYSKAASEKGGEECVHKRCASWLFQANAKT